MIINKSGYIALTSVILISAVIIATVVSMTYSSIGEAQSGLALLLGDEELHFVEGCVDDALLKIRSDGGFGQPVGTPVNLSRPEGTCIITVNSITGISWNLTIAGDNEEYQRAIQVIINRNPTGINLVSWKEI